MKSTKTLKLKTVLIAVLLVLTPGARTSPLVSRLEGRAFTGQIKLESFNDITGWTARGSSGIGETRLLRLERGQPFALPDKQDQNEDKYFLGVKTYFQTPGKDKLEVLPPRPIRLPVRTARLKINVLGRNAAHTLYIRLQDCRGAGYDFRLGKLNFRGARQMSVKIPVKYHRRCLEHNAFEPEPENPAPGLAVFSLKVKSAAGELGGNFFLYLDNLQAELY